jgi:hypothetical protein
MEVLSFVSERSIDRLPSLRQEAAKRPVNFVVGQSDPAKDWYATQLAVLASAEDAKTLRSGEAPGVINFSIDSPKANYRLHLSLLIESASVPALWRQAAPQ